MKKKTFFLSSKLWCLGAFALSLLATSCAQDGFDDETFESGVKNAQLLSPAVSDISITSTVDKSQTIIEWKVVNGAGGYDCKVYNVTEDTPVVVLDSIIDGTSFAIPRETDNNYQFIIKTLGNAKLGNSDAETATVVPFTSFVEAYGEIPNNANLTDYFKDAIGEDAPEEIYFDLAAGGTYTVSGPIDFGGNNVILRCTDRNNRPTVKFTVSTDDEGKTVVGKISTSAPMTLQNINFDYSDIPNETSNYAAIYLSDTPDESIKGLIGTQTSYYNITNGAIYIVNCDFNNIKGAFLYDNNVSSYCIESMIVENCRVHFNIPAQKSNWAYIYVQGGLIKDLTIKNSTFWNTGAGDLQYFIRYNNSGRIDRAGYNSAVETESVNHINSTFYNIAYQQWANYSAFAGQAYTTFEIKNNIFVDCADEDGTNGIARRLLGGRAASSYSRKCEFGYNTYWHNGEAAKEGAPANVEGATATYDTSGTALQSNPALVNPNGGDLTPTGSEQVARQTGDPYWFSAK